MGMNYGNYIEVAVALPVHGCYTYEVPEQLAPKADVGMRALVPFGRRRVTGYILRKKNESGGIKTKKILDLLDEEPLFPGAMLPFFEWAAGYYIYPLGEVIKAALPMGLTSHDVSVVKVTQKGEESMDKLSPGERDLLAHIRAEGPLPVKLLVKQRWGQGCLNLIRKMETSGLVSREFQLKKDGVRMKTQRFVRLVNPPEKGARLSQKRKEILKRLEHGREISVAALKEEIPTAPVLVTAMARAGLLEISQRQVFRDPLGDPVTPDTPPTLTPEQETVVARVKENMGKGFRRYLLSGVTGSGKTEVYMRLVQDAVDRGLGAIVLVPEISLISQTERRFRARFGKRIAVLHSGLSRGELLDQWQRIAHNEATIVIGARSAIFAPVEKPGLIIVDEEHDTSYKQETGFRYNARDMAVVRAKIRGGSVILGSATPSVQSYFNTCQGKFEELKLLKRVNQNPLPEITLVDLKKYKDARGWDRLVTPELGGAIRNTLDRGEQVLIFLNRRGFATFPVCESCGETMTCKNCDLTMTLHMGAGEFRCHLCGFSVPANQACPHCGSGRIKPLGFGTEKLETVMKARFPDARVARLDQDTGSRKGATVSILKKVKHRTVDIIVGTQMLAKGHDFPFITLVGVICADLSLNFPDFRAGERTFQLLAQVAGRAGRGKSTGRVIMQTFSPDHFSIEASRKQDFVEFYNKEIPFRRELGYPPFSRIIQLKISGTDKDKVAGHAMAVGRLCQEWIDRHQGEGVPVQILGPIEAGIPRIALRYRWQILLKGASVARLNALVQALIRGRITFTRKDVRVAVDVDPYSMM